MTGRCRTAGRTRVAVLMLLLVPLAVAPGIGGASAVVENPVVVAADGETVPVGHSGDAADDPAIWVHPTDPGQSLIIGNDKQGALETYNLDGSRQQQITTASTFWGNVDVRQGVTIGSRTLDIAAVYNDGLRFFTIDPSTRQLTLSTDNGGAIFTPLSEGLCLYHSQISGDLYVNLIARAKRIRQYRVTDPDKDGLLQTKFLREFRMTSESEGCVADDERGRLYIDQEDVGLWRFGAEPTASTTGTLIDQVQPDGHLAADAEGVTLIDTGGDGGYIVASAQNIAAPRSSYFVAYDRDTNAYVGSFRIGNGPTADACERTDGIAAYFGALGSSYPQGVFVCQDNGNRNPAANQDFKLTRIEKVLAAL
ncbi:MAG TPA: phytase [Nocardioidaceae bacterium]|nr:phytase [Nocardioidaceae bacterium]